MLDVSQLYATFYAHKEACNTVDKILRENNIAYLKPVDRDVYYFSFENGEKFLQLVCKQPEDYNITKYQEDSLA